MAEAHGPCAAVIDGFLAGAGWGAARRLPLPGDASFRRYVRLIDGDSITGARRALLMEAPPGREDLGSYLLIARHLCALGYSAPAILAADRGTGLALIEDFGDATFTRLIAGGADQAALYLLAGDLLIDLHRRDVAHAVPQGVARYDDTRLLDEAALLVDWYWPAVTGAPVAPALRAAYLGHWQGVLPVLRALPETLVLRDFHVDNLMHLPGRAGLAACGLLDFQDAVRGPVAYDLMSLLEDARRDVPDALAVAHRQRYLDAFPALDRDGFDAAFAVLAAQRHCKVIGIFTRLAARDGKSGYLAHIPRVWRLAERALGHPALGGLRRWLDRELPVERRIVPAARTTLPAMEP